jgi:hypothetical protein
MFLRKRVLTDGAQSSESRTAFTLRAGRTQALEEARERQRKLAEARAVHGNARQR